MKKLKFILLIILGLNSSYVFSQAKTVANIKHPFNYTRNSYIKNSFSEWIQQLPIKATNDILSHGNTKINNSLYHVFAVVQMPLLFKTDLEQCADYSMRFWAEFHKAKNKLNDLYLFDYSGTRKYYKSEGKSYTNFLQWAFNTSNSSSLKNGCKEVPESDLQPGDMFVQNETGGIGHVSMIVDVCSNGKGEKLYLIGYSFMPAQEFHIEKAMNDYGVEGWFSLEGYYKYLKENLNFGKPGLRRFVK
jgi:hypothetical protein